MTIDLATLHTMAFAPTHYLVLEADIPIFKIHSAAIKHKELERDTLPSVYMWLSPQAGETNFDVLYVGKAGYGVSRRISQHQGGFTNSVTGRENRRLITEWLAAGRTIEVHRRISSQHLLLGQEVSLYSAEEQALCERYNPLWNRARFPRIQLISETPSSADVLPEPYATPTNGVAFPSDPVDSQTPEVDFSQVAQGDEITAFLGALDKSKRFQFLSLCELLLRLDPQSAQKLVSGYVGQPKGYDNKPLYVFGHIGNDGRARHRCGWIPLTDSQTSPLTVIFPAKARSLSLDKCLFVEGSTGNWRPLDLSHFLAHTKQYIGL